MAARERPRTFLSLCVLIFSGIAVASPSPQGTGKQKPSDQFTLTSIEVTGNKHYTRDQVVPVTGLHIGQSVSDDGKTINEGIFQKAVAAVGKTGAFSDVSYRYEYSAKGTKLELQVHESDKFLAAQFDNFVWFSDSELTSTLRERVQLFDGALPTSGTMTDQVAHVLERMLSERNLPGTVEYIPTAQKMGGPIDAITYHISDVTIRVANIDFPGAEPAESTLLQSAAKPLSGQEYSRSAFRAQDRFNFRPIYLARGYLNAEFADSQTKLSAHGNASEILVDVTIPVATGRQYKVGGIEWTGNTVFPTEKLQSMIHLRVGEPANAVQLVEDIQAIQQLYGTRGYVAAQAVAAPGFDDASSTVRYVFELHEGDLYRMGTVEVEGLDTALSRTVTDMWKLRTGNPYDSSYSKQQFLTALAKSGISIPRDLTIAIEETKQDDKTVNVKIIFAPKKSP
jgi:outer membrane protein insertion porin family